MKTLSCSGIGILVLLAACNDSGFKGSANKLNPTLTREYSQDAYPAGEASFIQGHLGAPEQLSFDQGEWGALDLLVVVDTSASMQEEQQNLASKLEPLLSKVDKADWQIAVITTDRDDGCQRALIKKGDVNGTQRFQDAVNAGIKGSGIERGIERAVDGLKCAQSPWVRAGSTVAVLILSDEDNCHTGKGDDDEYACQGEAGRNAAFLTDYLKSIRTIGKDARAYGLIWDPAQDQTQCTTALNRGHEYAKAISDTQGKIGSICDADYTQTLEAISNDVAQILKYSFELEKDPDDGQIEVLVDGQPWDKFTLEGRTVKFTEPPPFGSKVSVNFRIGREGELATSWKLPKPASPGSVKVLVDGEELPADQVSYDAASQTVAVTEPPPERAEIKVVYKELVPLPGEFRVEGEADPKTIGVTVDGKPAKFKYDEARRVVTVDPPPPESSKVKVSYKAKA